MRILKPDFVICPYSNDTDPRIIREVWRDIIYVFSFVGYRLKYPNGQSPVFYIGQASKGDDFDRFRLIRSYRYGNPFASIIYHLYTVRCDVFFLDSINLNQPDPLPLGQYEKEFIKNFVDRYGRKPISNRENDTVEGTTNLYIEFPL